MGLTADNKPDPTKPLDLIVSYGTISEEMKTDTTVQLTAPGAVSWHSFTPHEKGWSAGYIGTSDAGSGAAGNMLGTDPDSITKWMDNPHPPTSAQAAEKIAGEYLPDAMSKAFDILLGQDA
jgi:hypothetical protein